MIRGSIIKKNVRSFEAPIFANIHNKFELEVIDSTTGELKQKAQAYNTVCNNLWSRMIGNGATYFNYIHYGTGSGTPSTADTSLFSFLGSLQCASDNKVYGSDPVNGVYSVRRSVQLTSSMANGYTITEVGIGYDSGSATLCTHAVLKDMNGNPISINKTSTDVINIYATVYAHVDPGGYGGSFYPWPIGEYFWGSNMLGWMCGVNSFSFSHAFFSPGDTAAYAGTQYGNGNPPDMVTKSISKTTDVGGRKLTLRVSRLEAAEANFGGIRLIDLGDIYSYSGNPARCSLIAYPMPSWGITNRVVGEAVGTGDGSTKDFSLSIGFAKNAKVYIDGIETTDFSLDYAPTTLNWYKHIRALTLDSTEEYPISMPVYIGGGNTVFNGDTILYNPMWEIGVSYISWPGTFNSYMSDDMVNWEPFSKGNISAANAHKKYWKLINGTGTSSGTLSVKPVSSFTGKVLHFTNPPPSGAVITADYDCDCIPKDGDHVLDLTFTIQFGEYTEAQ